MAAALRAPILALSAILLVLGSVQASVHGLFHQPGSIPQFLAGVGVMGLGYALGWRLLGGALSAAWFWAIALATRLIFLPMYPGSDIWRYLWEGAIQLQGFSPYEQAPDAPELLAYRTDWWASINNADVSAIYPPITQLGFRVLAALTQPALGDVDLSVLAFKLAFVAADVAICWLLWRRFGTWALLYAWNPLVIYSFAGGGHYDSWLMLPMVAAWLYPLPEDSADPNLKTPLVQALLVGISIGVKWISLPMLAFLSWRLLAEKTELARRSRWAMAVAVMLVGLLPVALSSLVYCDATSCPLIPTGSTFVESARTAEFLPYFIGFIWPESLESNRLLALPLGIVTLVLLIRCRSLGRFILNYLIALLLLSPIVHAWYVTWVIPFAVGRHPGDDGALQEGAGNWGPIWGSLSVFVYFIWTGQQAGDFGWFVESWERPLIWGPLVAGCLWTGCQHNETRL